MLGFFKGKSKDNIIYSPCKGKVVPITEVSITDTYWAGYGNAQGRTIYFTCFRWSAGKKG